MNSCHAPGGRHDVDAGAIDLAVVRVSNWSV